MSLSEPDALDMATTELAEAMVPTPEDMLADVGPLAQAWYLQQLAYHVMRSFTAFLSTDEAGDVADDSEPVRALGALTTLCGIADGICVTLSILPAEAAGPPA